MQMPRDSGADVHNETPGTSGVSLESWISASQDLSAQQVIKPDTAVAASLQSVG